MIMEFFANFNIWLNEFLLNAGILAPIISCLLIFLEGILAFLPLFVFITINILTLGPVIGCFISWFFTIMGSFAMFFLTRRLFSNNFQKKLIKRKKLNKVMNIINNLKFTQLVLIIAIPFAPSFFINLGAGLSKISKMKFFYALVIGKVFVVLFWGYIGANLIECLTNPIEIIKVLVMMLLAYVFSKFINKKFNIDERY